MMHDIIIPCKVGNYYLHTKRVLAIEVYAACVMGIVLEYSGKSRKLISSSVIFLKDTAQSTQIHAIKKLVSSVGKVDEVVTTLATSAIVFKEMQLPFIGRDSLEMIIPFEVEPILPFTLQEAVIDFIVTHEDVERKVSTVLIAAVRREDIQAQYDLFVKADMHVNTMLLDVFVLYTTYRATLLRDVVGQHQIKKNKVSLLQQFASLRSKMYSMILRKPLEPNEQHADLQVHNFKPKRSELVVDIGFNSIKVMYLKDGMLHGIRVIPFGFTDGLERMSQELSVPYADLMHDIMMLSQAYDMTAALSAEFKRIFDELQRTLEYFAQQEGTYFLQPYRILFSGFYVNQGSFLQQAQSKFGQNVMVVQPENVLQDLQFKIVGHQSLSSEYMMLLAAGLSFDDQDDHNLLSDMIRVERNKFMYMFLGVMLLLGIVCVGATWMRSMQELSKWNTAYNSSKKQLLAVVEQQMHLDLKGEKNLKVVVEKTEEAFKKEKQRWLVFTRHNETSMLEYLQDLSLAIDRHSIGLDVRQMHLDSEKVTMTGSVKSFEKLDVFDEELQELKLLTVVEKPRELSWTIQLRPKSAQKGSI